MQTIDFQAARARALKLAQAQMAYVDIEFTNAELVPPANKPTLCDLLGDCIDAVGTFGVREEILK